MVLVPFINNLRVPGLPETEAGCGGVCRSDTLGPFRPCWSVAVR
jgi:hypothetical protein